jgi:hypothetical protein
MEEHDEAGRQAGQARCVFESSVGLPPNTHLHSASTSGTGPQPLASTPGPTKADTSGIT